MSDSRRKFWTGWPQRFRSTCGEACPGTGGSPSRRRSTPPVVRHWTRRGRVALSLAHMHCNRVFGIDRAREQEVYALVHGALTLRMDRGRHGR
ncbi:lantibiotic dehydratase C-terminal domain-containing protein [Amycolatopsis methanolica]|uniref:lantibiotic dehydratase C-terminal domain-containing protein n=1 Tax=Amycolatopsis methanolica TaxID=1814 RepID=UPI002B3FFFDA|nr:lantibiotic dehydratase C-terminal domain-containing protein [Amycolatopsis methanolica]